MGISVFTDTFIEVLKIDRMELTKAYLIGTALSGFMITRGGKLFDRLGARKFIVLASILFGIALLYMSQIDRLVAAVGFAGISIASLIVSSIGFLGIRFFGQGLVTLGSRSMLTKWWNLRRGRMVAISGCFVSFGFSLAPRVLDWEIQAFGWRGAFIANALLIGIGVSSIGWLFFRDNPEECGLAMDNGWKPENRLENPDTFLAKEFTGEEAKRTYAFWMITLILAFQGLFGTAYTFHILDLARHLSVEKTTMLNFFIYTSVLSVVINFAAGYITDRTRLRFIITFVALSGALACLGLFYLPGNLGKVLLVLGMGCSWGAFPVLSNVGYARYFGRKHIGSISGASMAWMVWGSAVGPLLFSLGHRYLGGYEVAILYSLLMYMILAICSVFTLNPSRIART